jgi:glycosyltransferase involved in cell wall biosynthesis
MPDLIEHQQNGYLAQPEQPEDLAQGIDWILADDTRHQHLRRNSRAKAIANFQLEQQTQKYLQVFTDLRSKLAP